MKPVQRLVICSLWEKAALPAEAVTCEVCLARCAISPATVRYRKESGFHLRYRCIKCAEPIYRRADSKLEVIPGQLQEARDFGLPVTKEEQVQQLWKMLRREN